MIQAARTAYNTWFSEEKHQQFLNSLNTMLPYPVDFRVSETPLFLSGEFKLELENAAYAIVKQLQTDAFREHAKGAIPEGLQTPYCTSHPEFLQVDFAIAQDSNGSYLPQLIELQGFPSLYGFQYYFAQKLKEYYAPANDLTPYFSSYDEQRYLTLLRKIILGNHAAENVVLLEIEPEKQKTRIDFAATAALTGIAIVCVTRVIKEGKKLYYKNENGRLTEIKRIYNRVILDELHRKPVPMQFSFHEELDVEWAGHPDWYFLISKHTLPFLTGKYVSGCSLLSNITAYPDDLENYVLKPLYSFAGLGVEVDIDRNRLDEITDRSNYILQKKITYAPLIQTPDGFAMAEIRMMFLWDDEPVLVNNLVRQSKGKMMGVDFNKNKTWVGSSCALF